jgi:two-component system, OmpR family, sensor histidine kinase KdpD
MKKPMVVSSERSALQHSMVLMLLLAVASGVCGALDPQVSLTSLAMVYMLAVVVAAYALPWLFSMVAALGAVMALNFFFVPPRWTLVVESRENLIALGTMLLVAFLISHLVSALRRESATAQLHAARSHQLQQLATELAAVNSAEEVLQLGRAALELAFVEPVTLVLADAAGALGLAAQAEAQMGDGLRCCMREAAVLGPGTGRWPGLQAWYIPVGDKGRMHGAACIQNVQAQDTSGRDHAHALCVLLAQTLWRLKVTMSMQQVEVEAHRQHMLSTFLAAISHDLRTPLAALVGSASALQTQREKLSLVEQDRMLGSMVQEAHYLSRVTENTLQLVRLVNASQDIRRDWESVEEIVGAVLARVRQEDPTRRISSRVPANLPLIRVDPVLVSQLMSNLLENALKYSQGPIDLVVTSNEQDVQISVKDRAEAIPPENYDTIFQPYMRGDQSGQRGAGLGLALCRAIAQAHGGTLIVRRRSGGGNSFTFALPLVQQPQPVQEKGA